MKKQIKEYCNEEGVYQLDKLINATIVVNKRSEYDGYESESLVEYKILDIYYESGKDFFILKLQSKVNYNPHDEWKRVSIDDILFVEEIAPCPPPPSQKSLADLAKLFKEQQDKDNAQWNPPPSQRPYYVPKLPRDMPPNLPIWCSTEGQSGQIGQVTQGGVAGIRPIFPPNKLHSADTLVSMDYQADEARQEERNNFDQH